MTAPSQPRGRAALRWSLSLAVVLAAHAGGAAALLAWREPHDAPAAPAVLIELAAVASAPAPEASDLPPGPRQEMSQSPPGDKPEETPPVPSEALARQLPEPDPLDPVTLPAAEPDRLAAQLPLSEPPPEVALAVPLPEPQPPRPRQAEAKPEPRPEAKPAPREKPAARKLEPARKPRATQTTAPASAPTPQVMAATPPPGVAAQPSPDVVRRWQATLVAHLQRHKRYPGAARRDNEEGVAYLRFAMDRSGTVLLKRLERASGHPALDQETLALVERAQPLPPPPAEVPGERFEFVLPVQFQLR